MRWLYNLGNFLRTLATPEPINWSLTSLKEKLDQDRREDRDPRPLCRLSDGRDRHSEKFVRREFASDRRIAAASSSINRVRRCMSPFRAQPTGGLRPNDGKNVGMRG